MHQPIESGIEDYLTGRAGTENYRGFVAHLDACAECAAEVGLMKQQAEWMRELRPPADTEPSAGFYGRVMDRIEAQSAKSFWGVFLEPVFANRLALACLALFLVLTSAVWQTNPSPVLHESNPVSILAAGEMPAATGADPSRDRTVVLTNFASYGSERGPAPLLPVSSD
jgi:hypothetical protein